MEGTLGSLEKNLWMLLFREMCTLVVILLRAEDDDMHCFILEIGFDSKAISLFMHIY